MKNKPFKTYRQQLNILRDRNLDVGNTSKTMRYLEEENYYNIVNGYKRPFLKRGIDGKTIHPEEFKNGSSLDEMHSLYMFDRELRTIFLKYFLTFESNLKSRVSYRFSERFKDGNSYLDFNNFSSRSEKLKDVLKTINILSSTISNYATRKGTSIQHYIDAHNEVPLWVLSGYLTMGNIGYFYSCSVDSLKNIIVQDFNKQYNRDYRRENKKLSLKSDDLDGIIQTINSFRNVCAHEEILYTHKIKRPRRRSGIKNYINVELPTQDNLFTVYFMLTLVLRKKDKKNLQKDLKNVFSKFSNNFKSILFSDIKDLMGFRDDWDNL